MINVDLDKMCQSDAIKYLQKIGLWDECLIRMDGRIEWGCKHGVGHTIWASNDGTGSYIHGCDGCCAKLKRKEE